MITIIVAVVITVITSSPPYFCHPHRLLARELDLSLSLCLSISFSPSLAREREGEGSGRQAFTAFDACSSFAVPHLFLKGSAQAPTGFLLGSSLVQVESCSYLNLFILPDDQGCQPLFSLGREESGCGAPPSKRPGRVPRPPASAASLRGAFEVIVRGSGSLGLRLSRLWQIKRALRGPHTLKPFCLLPF